MAKSTKQSPAVPPEETFGNLMMVAAEFASSRGGIEPAKQSLADAAKFIEQAGSVAQATQALVVLESLKAKIGS